MRRTDWLPVGPPMDDQQLTRSKESADEFYDGQDVDNELNYNGSEDEQADDQDREYEQQERMCLSMGNADIRDSDDEEEQDPGDSMEESDSDADDEENAPRLALSMESSDSVVGEDFAGPARLT